MRSTVLVATAALSLAGCALRPPPVEDAPLRAQAPLATPGPAATDSAAGAWPDESWWSLYQDPTLDALIELALGHAPSLDTAAARLASARESVRVTGAALGVQVESRGQLQRQRLSDNGLMPPELVGFNWYNQADLGLAASYSFDWWGRRRAGVESALDQARAAQAESAAARIGLSAAVAQAYFGWQADAARLALARERLQLAERGVLIAQRRLEAELDSGEDVQRAAQELAGVRDTVAMLEGSQQLRRVTLAALLGVSPDALPPLSARPLPTVDAALPGDLSLDLIARRPDVQASRWRVEAARASLRSVRAEYYPDVSLRALAGLSSLQIGELLQPGSAVPSLTAAVHLPLFDAGLRDARFGVGQAQVRAAVADYDSTVVDAAREVGGAVTRLTRAAARREQHQARGAAAGQLLRATDARVRAGTTDLRPRLEAERALLHEADALAQVELELLDADISLRQALGGGYDSRKQTPP